MLCYRLSHDGAERVVPGIECDHEVPANVRIHDILIAQVSQELYLRRQLRAEGGSRDDAFRTRAG